MRLATTLAFTVLLVQAAAGPAQQQRPLPGTIQGVVLQAGSGDPVPKAQVTLSRVFTPPAAGATPAAPPLPVATIPPVITDTDGKFAFTDLEPGAYRIVAGRNGFVRMNYGERYPGGPGTIVTLPAGQTLKDFTFRLQPTATISGRVRDTSGDPAAGLLVTLMKPIYNPNGRTFQTVGSGRTDDRGEYRLFWISPGRYYLAVTGNRNSLTLLSIDGILIGGGASPNEIPNLGQPTVFYPGVVDPSRAVTVEVGSGRELSGIDVLLPHQPVHRVRGRVVDANGQPPRTVSMSLIPRDIAFATLGTGSVNANYNPGTGTFDLRDIVPGNYWLRAQASESTATATIQANLVGRTVSEALTSISGTRMAAQIPLDVSGDREGIVLSMSAGLSIPGILRVEGAPLPATPAPRVMLRPTAPNGLSIGTQLVNADGTFTLLNTFSGEYRLGMLNIPADYYVKEARIEQTDVLNQPWVIGDSVRGTVDIVLSSAGGQIEGTVLDSKSQPVSAILTVLIPDQDRSRAELIKTAQSDQDGKFTFRGITPGSYKIFAWEGIETNSYLDPDVISQHEQQAKAVRILEGQKLVSEVRMIPVKAQD
ncbi:MAG TPA: carboxypeptidase-like regulatory domain-containing protein [Terriglobia bacterium]|nr:carboxypeptidase-like regulatory domain-containing protein [Terriglobia bacterium]